MIRDLPSRTAFLPLCLSWFALCLPSIAQEAINTKESISTQESATPQSSVRGVIQSVSKIEIRSDLNVLVTQADFRKGMAFKKGDLLVAFDCARLKAERTAASASANAASIELRQKRTLLKHGAAGKGDENWPVPPRPKAWQSEMS